ncbi:tetratricopeptide repeat protein [Phosphitispora sp. TUW77]|uniref:tetratricopeptide repeat protein n=1 Tax=Phosphitispora sp. TUW77 TaxID=3152361 RepID=UPI003AB45FED
MIKNRVMLLFKGLGLYFLLSFLTRSPLLALVIIFLIYVFMDRAYIGFLPDFLAPFKRNSRIKRLREVLRVNPVDAGAAQELGSIYLEKKNYSSALEYLNKALEKVTNSPRLYLYLGIAYMELQQADQGKEFLEKALELDSRVGRGLVYIYLTRYELTHKGPGSDKLKQFADSFANFANTENLYRMGMVYKKTGNQQKANEMFHKALEEYSHVPGQLKKLHRRWAFLARLHSIF